jgi:C-terminal processing protease CtpA/Prc
MHLNDDETMKNLFLALSILFILNSCAVSKNNYNPNKKFSPEQLQKDYELFRDILEDQHPSLYWYTPKDSVDYYFEVGASRLKDSLPEYKFRNVLSYVLAQIHCGHTSVRASKAATKYSDRVRSWMFPLNIKAWKDTVVITSNLSRSDTNVMRGSMLKSIDNKPIEVLIDSMFQHVSADGYNTTHKYQTLSNGGVFRSMYGSIYGLKSKTPIEYVDTAGVLKKTQINLGIQSVDTAAIRRRKQHPMPKKERKKLLLQSQRNLKLDTSLNTAFLEVNTFASGNHLRPFFKKSFKKIRRQNIQNLVVDLRGNGGGNVLLSNLLTKYISRKPFKIADTLYALKRKSSYRQYENNYFVNRLFLLFLTHKRPDGYYHFTHYEKKYFKPKKKNHFDGTTYILTGGNTFSAATLFTKALVDQPQTIVVGEETGGGAYGNTAWLIPDVTLPNTKVRFRMPLFRLVVDKDAQKGRGVMPEVEAVPSVNAIRKNEDYKMSKVLKMIKGELK